MFFLFQANKAVGGNANAFPRAAKATTTTSPAAVRLAATFAAQETAPAEHWAKAAHTDELGAAEKVSPAATKPARPEFVGRVRWFKAVLFDVIC